MVAPLLEVAVQHRGQVARAVGLAAAAQDLGHQAEGVGDAVQAVGVAGGGRVGRGVGFCSWSNNGSHQGLMQEGPTPPRRGAGGETGRSAGRALMEAPLPCPSPQPAAHGIFATLLREASAPCSSRPCSGLAPGAKGSPRLRPSGVEPGGLERGGRRQTLGIPIEAGGEGMPCPASPTTCPLPCPQPPRPPCRPQTLPSSFTVPPPPLPPTPPRRAAPRTRLLAVHHV